MSQAPAQVTVDPKKLHKPADSSPLKPFGGSDVEEVNRHLMHQAVNSTWLPDQTRAQASSDAALGMLAGIDPRDGVEGMLAAQMVATHNAAMECFRRAMIEGQPLPGREHNLGQANRLVRSMATLVQALDKHRGKGQQTVRVEHVHVHAGGQAIVGPVAHGSAVPPTSSAPAAIMKVEDEPLIAEVAEGELDAVALATGGRR